MSGVKIQIEGLRIEVDGYLAAKHLNELISGRNALAEILARQDAENYSSNVSYRILTEVMSQMIRSL